MINCWTHWVFEWDDSSDMIILGNLEPIALPILFNPSQSVPTLLETFQTNPEKNLLQISSLCRVQMVLTTFPGISNTKRLGEILRGIWILRWVVLNLLHRVNQADFGLFYGWRSVGDKRYVSPSSTFPHRVSEEGVSTGDRWSQEMFIQLICWLCALRGFNNVKVAQLLWWR